MRVFGSVTYTWHGKEKQAVASREVHIVAEERWLAVGRLGYGTELVPWECVSALSGWSPVAEVDR